MNFENIPGEIKANALFCLWKYERRKGKPTKPPFNHRTGGYAKSNDPGTFGAFDEVLEVYQAGGYEGVGMGIFGEWGAVDIDHCFVDGELTPKSLDIIETMNSYTEISPSGEGVRIIFKAPGFIFNKDKWYINHDNLEVYIAGSTKKYVTLTGNVLRDLPVAERDLSIVAVLETYMKRERPTETTRGSAPPTGDYQADAEYNLIISRMAYIYAQICKRVKAVKCGKASKLDC